MCGIGGALLQRPSNQGDVNRIRRMIGSITHRGPDSAAVTDAGHAVLGSARLAIVDVAHGHQPFRNGSGAIHAVFNGEIYNHPKLRERLQREGHRPRTESEIEIIALLYEAYGADFVSMLDGQFAIALADTRSGILLLARDPMGICPLHWVQSDDGIYFCSEIKGLHAIDAAPRQVEPEAILQMSYFGAVCAPLTAFKGVRQVPAAHRVTVHPERGPALRRYWSLQFPRRGDWAIRDRSRAIEGVQQHLSDAVQSHVQGEFPATCFLSGGIDSAVIGAVLSASQPGRTVTAFCAASDSRKIDEGDAAQETAKLLGLEFVSVRIDEARIAKAFPKLMWHAEVPAISTEAAALMLLAERVQERSKIVLTGEGADEAFGGYLAFRQYKAFGALTNRGLAPLRTLIRPALARQYGSDCLLPPERRLDVVREHFGCFPAQAYEWEFYRAALTPVLAPAYRDLAAREQHWNHFDFDRSAVQGRHELDRSLYVAYQVMLPNYLLGPHGDRIFAANSVEGRYPFLSRPLVEFAATVAPALKIKRFREKYVLRRAAERWLPKSVTQRPKRRFVMPFGTPFLDDRAPALYRHLLSDEILSKFGYFDTSVVRKVVSAMRTPSGANGARAYLERLAIGLTINFVVSTQLWHHLFIAGGSAADADHVEPRRTIPFPADCLS